MTASEIILTATIWALTGIGCFFGLRAAWRRKKTGSDTRKEAPGTDRR